MTLHPQAQAICDALAAAPAMELSDATLAEQRAAFGALMLFAGPVAEGVVTVDHEIAGVPCRVHRPAGDGSARPIVVLFHGGGFTIGTATEFDPIGARVAAEADAIVVVPDYRLAPEHPFPAAVDDAWAVLRWCGEHAEALGGDPTRLAVMGDSAGGNLAAVSALLARDAGGPRLALQALVYPVTDARADTASIRENGEGYLLTAAHMAYFLDCYLRGGADPGDWRVSPLRADDLAGVAPAVVLTAGYDPLRDEGDAYAERLAAAGVPVEHLRYPGMIHGFFGLGAAFDDGAAALSVVAAALRQAFGAGPA